MARCSGHGSASRSSPFPARWARRSPCCWPATVFRDAVEARFPDFVARVNRGVARDGARYLFAARLTPLVPFFAINLGVGLTRMRVSTFVLVTLVGALPIVVLYVAAGQQFASIAAPQDILSARIVVALIALAAAPFAAKGLGAWRESRAALAAWPRPRRFDYNLIVVGAGSAGLVAAYVAAAARARVLLIEQGAMGGDCLNTGCVPSKALIRSAKLAHEGRRPEDSRPDRPARSGLCRGHGARSRASSPRSRRTIRPSAIAASAPK